MELIYKIYTVITVTAMFICLLSACLNLRKRNIQKSIIMFYALIQLMYIPIGIQISILHSSPIHTIFLTATGAVSFVLVYFLSGYTAKQIRLEKASQFLDEQIILQDRHTKEMSLQYESVEKFKTEFKNTIEAIREINKSGSISDVQKSINELSDKVRNSGKLYFTGIPAIDSIMYFKLNTAKEYNIKMNISVRNIDLGHISEIDICSIIANLLDNAIEACLRETGEKYIDFNIKLIHGYLTIGTKNPCSSFSASTKKSNPKEHGIGMIIIDDIVKRYGGEVERKLIDGEIFITVSLPEV